MVFRDTVHPFLGTYCLGCHGKEKPKGDLDLSAYPAAETVARDLPRWETVLEQLKSGVDAAGEGKATSAGRAPAGCHRLDPGGPKQEAKRTPATRPGPRARLSNAEYDHTIRDLTGVDIRPTQEFPVDPANEAGFDNSAESLTMSPALLKKYLEAARRGCRTRRAEARRDYVRTVPGGRGHRSRQILRAADHRFLRAAAD